MNCRPVYAMLYNKQTYFRYIFYIHIRPVASPQTRAEMKEENKMRVIMFDIDTLRADHMGCYGYGRNTTPVIDSIAQEGVRFDDYYTPTLPACPPERP